VYRPAATKLPIPFVRRAQVRRSLSSEHYTARRAAHPSLSILPFPRNLNSIRKLRLRGRGGKMRYAASAESRRPQPNGNLVVS
jgi:hypothetical protein